MSISQNSSFSKSVITKALGYTQPRVCYGKSIDIVFSAYDALSGKMRTKRIKINHLGTERHIRQREHELCSRFEALLKDGWSPFWTSESVKKHDVVAMAEVAPKKNTVTIGVAFKNYKDYIELEYSRKVLSHATIVTYTSYIKLILAYFSKTGLKNLDDVTLPCLRAYIDSLSRRNCSVKYCNSILGFIKTVFGWFVCNGYIEHSPADALAKENMSRATKMEKFEDSELDDMFSKLRESNRLEFLLACYIEYYCYIRPNELYRIKVGDLNFAEQTIFVRAEISKNKKDNLVTMPRIIIELMIELGVHAHSSSDYLFGDRLKCGPKIGTRKQFYRYWINHVACPDGLCPELMGKNLSFYRLKSTGITNMLKRGVPSINVQNQARHSSLSTTEIYARTSRLKAPTGLREYQ